MVNDSKQERYAIHYPVFHIKEIDEQIKDYVNQELAGFKEDNAKAQAQDEDGPFELNIKYKVVYYTKDTASVVLNQYIEAGGVSGTTSVKTFNADLKQKKPLSLQDLFEENSDFLNRISSIAYQELKNRNPSADMALLKEGTSPQEEHFSASRFLKTRWNFILRKNKPVLNSL